MSTAPARRRPPPLVQPSMDSRFIHRAGARRLGSSSSTTTTTTTTREDAVKTPELLRTATPEGSGGSDGSSPPQKRRAPPPVHMLSSNALRELTHNNPAFDAESGQPPSHEDEVTKNNDDSRSSRQQVRKALALAKENPANFHQAACVFLLGGKASERSSKFPRPENVSRMTNAEMELAWDAANNSISKTERLVCHFTSMDSASMILGVDSPGFRASAVGQGGGGFFVCTAGPHELEWEQYQGGKFRERTGRELWGENWHHLLVGEKDEDKVEMVFFLKIPNPFYEQGHSIPGRDLVRIIPLEVLYEHDGYHWLQKEKIVKSYVLKRDAPQLQIVGEGPPPETNLEMKCLFAGLSLGLVLFQVFALLAIIWNTVAPSCANNLQCERSGTYCTATGGASGRCEACAYAGAPYRLDVVDATAFCANATRSYSAQYCDHSTANEELCAHPTCRACPGSSEDPNPGWGLPYRLAISRTGHGIVELHARELAAAEPSRMADFWMENSTWGITSVHTIIRGNVAAMQYSDFAMLVLASTVVSFSLAAEIRDIKLCDITIHDRAGVSAWRPQNCAEKGLVAALALGAVAAFANYIVLQIGWRNELLVLYLLVVAPAGVTLIDAHSGNSPWRIFLLATNALRRFAVVPLLAAAVPILVLFDSANAKDMALNTVGALFLLSVDNEAFSYALPDQIRTHVEEYGRAELGEKEARVLNAVKTWTWIPQVAAMVFPVLAVKHWHDPAGGWMLDPFQVSLQIPVSAMFPGIAAEALACGDAEIAVVEGVAVGTMASLVLVCITIVWMKRHSGGGASWAVVANVCIFVTIPFVLWRLDRRDGGARTGHYFAGFGKLLAGYGAFIAATGFMQA